MRDDRSRLLARLLTLQDVGVTALVALTLAGPVGETLTQSLQSITSQNSGPELAPDLDYVGGSVIVASRVADGRAQLAGTAIP